MAITRLILNRKSLFSLADSLVIFLKIPPHLIHIAALLCQTAISENKQESQTIVAINEKLQGSVATYFRFGEIVNYQIKKGLLLNLRVKKNFLIGEYLAKLQAKTWCLVQFFRLSAVSWLGAQIAWDNNVLACNYAKYSPI